MANLKKLLDAMKSGWQLLAGFAAWVLTIVSSFVIEPPQRSYFESGNAYQISKFIIAALAAIIIIPILKAKRKDYITWQRSAIILLLLIIVSLAGYNLLTDKFSVNFYDVPLIRGSTMFPQMEYRRDSLEQARQMSITDEEFVKMCQGRINNIWPEDELDNRFYLLTSIYIGVTVLIGTFIVSITQAIRCYLLKR